MGDKVFYMIVPKVSPREKLHRDQFNAIGRFMKNDKRRNEFSQKMDAEMYILKMGMPFECDVSEAFWL